MMTLRRPRAIRRLVFSLLLLSSAPAALAQLPSGATVQRLAQPNDPAELLAQALRTLAVEPNNLDALMTAGRNALALGDPNAAVGFFGHAQQIAPSNGQVKAGLGSALVQLEKPQDALRLFGEASRQGVPESEFAADRGLAYDLLGQSRQAQKDYQTVLAAHPDDDAVRRKLALSQGISGDKVAAIATLDPLIRKRDIAGWRAQTFVLAMNGDAKGASDITHIMLPTQADMLQPFLVRLASLSPADKAKAVNFGEMPQNGGAYTQTQLANIGPAPTYAGSTATQAAKPAAITSAPAVAPTAKPPSQPKDTARATSDLAPVQPSSAPTPLTLSGAAGTDRTVTPVAPPPAVAIARSEPPPATTKSSSPPPATRATAPLADIALAPVPASNSTTSSATPAVSAPVKIAQTAPATPAPAPGKTEYLDVPPAKPVVTEPRPVTTPAPAAAAPMKTADTPVVHGSAKSKEPPVKLADATDSAKPVKAPAKPDTAPADDKKAASKPKTSKTASADDTASSDDCVPTPSKSRTTKGHTTRGRTTHAKPACDAATDRKGKTATASADEDKGKSKSTKTAAADEGEDCTPTKSKSSHAKGRTATHGKSKTACVDETSTRGSKTKTASADESDKKGSKTGTKGKSASDDQDSGKTSKSAKGKADSEKPGSKSEKVYVQVAGGANKSDMDKAWAGVKSKAPELMKGKTPSTTPLKATNRLLVGPFKDEDEAQAFVNKMAGKGMSGFVFKSAKGQKVDKVGSDK